MVSQEISEMVSATTNHSVFVLCVCLLLLRVRIWAHAEWTNIPRIEALTRLAADIANKYAKAHKSKKNKAGQRWLIANDPAVLLDTSSRDLSALSTAAELVSNTRKNLHALSKSDTSKVIYCKIPRSSERAGGNLVAPLHEEQGFYAGKAVGKHGHRDRLQGYNGVCRVSSEHLKLYKGN